MKRLTILRHAEAQLAPGQREGDLFSVGDFPLSERGRAQAAAARDLLAGARFDGAFASHAKRAVETAEIVAAPHGLKVQILPDLHEFPYWTPGADYATILARIEAWPAALAAEPDPLLPGGERWSAAIARFSRAIDGVLARHDRPLVVAHGIANRAWLGRLLGMPDARLHALDQRHAGASVIEWRRGEPVLVALNATGGAT